MQAASNSPDNAASPARRLAASRAALMRQMTARHESTQPQPTGQLDENKGALGTSAHQPGLSVFKLVKQAVASWWQYHPAHIAVEAGRPYLTAYASNKPLQMLGIATGVGALLVLVKPWRLVSLTGLAVTAFQSSNLPASLMSLLTNLRSEPTGDPSPRSQKDNL